MSTGTLPERFWNKVDKGSTVDACWTWTAYRNKLGYGSYHVGNRRMESAYRVSYIALVGPIPEGLELDHLCRNHACVNPAHLEPVTHAENMRRWSATVTHCPRGHEYTPENTYTFPGRPRKACRICMAQAVIDCRARKWKERPERTHCRRGHELTPENTYLHPRTKGRHNAVRECRTCRKDRAKSLSPRTAREVERTEK